MATLNSSASKQGIGAAVDTFGNVYQEGFNHGKEIKRFCKKSKCLVIVMDDTPVGLKLDMDKGMVKEGSIWVRRPVRSKPLKWACPDLREDYTGETRNIYMKGVYDGISFIDDDAEKTA